MIHEAIRAISTRIPALYPMIKHAAIEYTLMTGWTHEPDYRWIAPLLPATGLFVDIGANTGQSALSLHAVHPNWRIFSVEPNPDCEPYLRHVNRRLKNKHEYLISGLSDEAGELEFFVPVRGFAMLQEGTFDRTVLDHPVTRDRLDGPFEIERLGLPVRTLDELDLAPTFVKLDAQGFEARIVAGGLRTIRRHQPVIMAENGDHIPEVAMLLAPLGYRPTGLGEAGFGVTPGLNVYFVTEST